MFKKATRTETRIRLGLVGPAGSGKTMTALRIGAGLLENGQRMAVIDTEHASANLYAEESNPDGGVLDFDSLDLASMAGAGTYSVDKYLQAIRMAKAAGYRVLVIDSLSHAWAGDGGVLEYVDQQAKKSRSGSTFAAWRQGTKLQNELVEALLAYPGHVIVTMRSKVEYVTENGKVHKLGLQPVQREGLDFEFTITADIDVETHTMSIGKTRCSALADRTFRQAGADVAQILRDWMAGAKEAPQPPPPAERPHHASWSTDRPRFCARLNELGTSYDEVKAALENQNKPKPSTWPQKHRDALVQALRDGPGWSRLGIDRPVPDAFDDIPFGDVVEE